MAVLVDRYLRDKSQLPLTIIDIGSYQTDDLNSSYRTLFNNPGWVYQGVDISAGPNVDIVLPSPYIFPIADNYADVIVSGQAFEHIEFFWLSWLEMVRVLKPGGYIMLIAPSRGAEHRYPVDCWRFYPDGFRALAKYGNVEVVEAYTDGLQSETSMPQGTLLKRVANVLMYLMRYNYHSVFNFWGDTVGVFRKP